MKYTNNIFILLFFYTLTLLSAQNDASVSFDVDITGNSIARKNKDDGAVSAKFSNLFPNETLHLFWEAEKREEDVLIAEIAPSSDAIITTFLTHTFYAVIASDVNTRAYPGTITVGDGEVLAYAFGPDPPSWKKGSLHPKVKYLNQLSHSMGARFKSLAPAVDIWYEDGKGGSYQGSIKIGQETTTNTYVGHVFFFTESGNKQKELARYLMKKEQTLYLVEDKDYPPPKQLRDQIDRELKHIEEYTNRTGVVWRHYFGPNGPRPPPKLHMWSAPEIGHIHQVSSNIGYWKCEGSAVECQSNDKLDFKIQVVSMEPKVFLIEKFFSEFEADKIMQLAFDKLKESLVGNKEAGGARTSDTRTSRNAWLSREAHPVIDALYKRAGNLLKIDEKILKPEYNAEMLQVVKYQYGQKYDAHHDWGVRNVPESRFLTLLLYLNDQVNPEAGGETSFPLAAGGRGIKVHAGKGNAVLFYNLLEDGNADELSLHCGTPVFNGTKWVSNMWIWDPKKT